MSDEIPKIHVLLGGGKPDATADLLRRANAEWDGHMKIMAFEAKRKKAQYELLIEAGFTPDQALHLVK
jgi:hypothetical protein